VSEKEYEANNGEYSKCFTHLGDKIRCIFIFLPVQTILLLPGFYFIASVGFGLIASYIHEEMLWDSRYAYV